MASVATLTIALVFLTWLQVAADASDQQIVYIRNTCECWTTDLKCICKIESDPTSVRPLMQRLVNRTAEYYWQEIEFQSMVYDRTTFILANTFADGPFPSGITFRGDFSIVNDSFNHLNMTLNKVELNFETFSGRKPKFSKQYWRYIFDHGEATLRSLRIIKYQIEDFIIPNYLGAALVQESRPLTEFKVVGCEVKEVKERAFKNFTQLEVLDLSDNHLTTLPENVFSRNINLQKILLANNQISFLTKTIFDGLPNLLLINLRKNKLTAVPAIPRHTNRRFQPMVYLMADNSIHCRCSLIWVLHELTFHHNLEIEATCSDPTMVRGMPIIEGFTRMDKEACYREAMGRKVPDMDDPYYEHYLSLVMDSKKKLDQKTIGGPMETSDMKAKTSAVVEPVVAVHQVEPVVAAHQAEPVVVAQVQPLPIPEPIQPVVVPVNQAAPEQVDKVPEVVHAPPAAKPLETLISESVAPVHQTPVAAFTAPVAAAVAAAPSEPVPSTDSLPQSPVVPVVEAAPKSPLLNEAHQTMVETPAQPALLVAASPVADYKSPAVTNQ